MKKHNKNGNKVHYKKAQKTLNVKIVKFFHNIKKLRIFNSVLKYVKYWPLIVITVLVFIIILQWTRLSWLVQSSVAQTKTYPYISVLGVNLGDLDANQLDNRLKKLKNDFEGSKITLVNDKSKWIFDFGKIGVSFDEKAVSKAIWELNKLNLTDKFKLLANGNSMVTPNVQIDSKKCNDLMSTIIIPTVNPKDASVYFDREIKIMPDKPGTKFNASLNCQKLPGWLADNLSTVNVYLDVINPNLTKADIESRFTYIKTIVDKPIVLKSGGYSITLTQDKILALLDISKNNAGVQVNWTSKLDELIDSIASQVNTNNASPALGACQYLINSGGNWLDKVATKKIFEDLNTNNSRSYNLAVIYHPPSIGIRTRVNTGSRGTVYLTFDDGLVYGNQIMNYAACYGIKVTFFELGSRVGTDASGIRRAIAEGHSVQSHGYEHALYDYGNRSYDWQLNDIAQSINAISGVTGVRPTYFRPPGGNRSANTYSAANANSIKLILWGITSSDSGNIGTPAICNNVLSRIFPGATVLMHSTRLDTTNALPCIIEGLARKGYSMQALR